ncbi:hypothetical protein NECID01_0924 [Nematocida sp. AWRm77]|nr:hypothetical protein NECID01_0924 [Nematocida sp. AWRm77]
MKELQLSEYIAELLAKKEEGFESMKSLVEHTKAAECMKEAVQSLKEKERKGVSYLDKFAEKYLETLVFAESPSYKSCPLVSKDAPKECTCVFKKAPGTECMHELDNIEVLLGYTRKAFPEETKKLLCAATRLALSTGEKAAVQKALRLIGTTEYTDSAVVLCLAECAHFFSAGGMEYSAVKALEVLSKVEKVAPSADRLRLMVMAKYFLQAENYRGYLLCIERLQSLQMCISPIPQAQEYAKYLRVSTDYDKLIGYKKTARKALVPGHATLFSVDVPHSAWQWYISLLGGSEPVTEESLEKVAFLRKHRMAYAIENGELFVVQGNVSCTYLDYINGLGAETDAKKEEVKHAVQSSRKRLAQKEMEGEKGATEPSTPVLSKESKAEKEQRKRRSVLRSMLEEKDFLFRMAQEKESAGEVLQLSTEEAEARAEAALGAVNSRFREAKQSNIVLLRAIAEAHNPLQALLSLLPRIERPVPVEEEKISISMERSMDAEREDFSVEESREKEVLEKPRVWREEQKPKSAHKEEAKGRSQEYREYKEYVVPEREEYRDSPWASRKERALRKETEEPSTAGEEKEKEKLAPSGVFPPPMGYSSLPQREKKPRSSSSTSTAPARSWARTSK